MQGWWNSMFGKKTPAKAPKKGAPAKKQNPKTPKIAPKAQPKTVPKTAPKTPKTAAKTTPKTTSKGTPKVTPKATPKTTSKTTPKASVKNVPKAAKKETKAEPKMKTPVHKTIDPAFKLTQEVLDHFGSRLSPMNQKPKGQSLFDVCAFLIHCSNHKKIAVSVEANTKFVWLPFISMPTGTTWTEAAQEGAYIIISEGDSNRFIALKEAQAVQQLTIMECFRLQLPQTQKFNIRLIYYVKLDPKMENCCADTKKLIWLPLDEVKDTKVASIFGPELVQFAQEIKEDSQEMDSLVNEFSLDQAFTYVPRDPPRNLEEDMLKSCNFTEKDVERIYMDYIEHCFPAFYMTKTSFCDYMSKYGFEKMDQKLILLFKAFNYKKTNYLTFHEFLLGLTSIDPMASNGLSRIKFLFKYFDVDSDGQLNEKELKAMVREINPTDKEASLQKKVTEAMKAMEYVKDKGIDFDHFSRAVGGLKFRGTSNLCRSNRPILGQISRSMATRSLKRSSDSSHLGAILADRKYKGICPSCRDKKYDFAIHKVKVNAEGYICDAEALPELSDLGKSLKSVKKSESKERTDSKEKIEEKKENKESIDKEEAKESKEKTDSDESLNKSDEKISSGEKSKSDDAVKPSSSSTGIVGYSNERFSIEIVWNRKSVANYFIEQIRIFNGKKGKKEDKKGLMDAQPERAAFVKKVKELCAEVAKIVVLEERCVKVSSPAFIIGDIHGNLEDLLTMEKVLWKSMPVVAANYVFLGDYVDRGQWGLECALYLMSLKLLAPNKVVLLRGNHEVRELQKNYSYKEECEHKYGDLGKEVWEVTNSVFDKLPFCAVIDDAIYCAHGGIPCSVRQIDKINEAQTNLPDPERESAVAWEILWSDPIGAQQFAEAADLLQVRVDTARGFLTNSKRGTAYLFAEEAANTFLQANGLTHIVRAHEVPAYGYTFHFGKKCTTVFSSSHYCGNSNEAAVIHVDNEKLRVVRMDTVNNAPAS